MLRISERSLSSDSQVNIVIGILSVLLAIASVVIGWATWRLHRRPSGHRGEVLLQLPHRAANIVCSFIDVESVSQGDQGYELEFRIRPANR